VAAAVTTDVVVVSLGDGHEWWDTRLLLASGATRLGHPRAMAFTATYVGKARAVPRLGLGPVGDSACDLVVSTMAFGQITQSA
jgi:hypothetical protein